MVLGACETAEVGMNWKAGMKLGAEMKQEAGTKREAGTEREAGMKPGLVGGAEWWMGLTRGLQQIQLSRGIVGEFVEHPEQAHVHWAHVQLVYRIPRE